MSSFTELIVSESGKDDKGRQLYKLDRPFTYYLGRNNSGIRIDVHAGFVTDFESIPNCLLKWVKRNPNYRKAFVIHDYCVVANTPWPLGVTAMVDTLKTLGCPWWKRQTYKWPVLVWGLIR